MILKIKLLPPTIHLSTYGSRRRSGLIVTPYYSTPVRQYTRSSEGGFLVTAAVRHAVVGAVGHEVCRTRIVAVRREQCVNCWVTSRRAFFHYNHAQVVSERKHGRQKSASTRGKMRASRDQLRAGQSTATNSHQGGPDTRRKVDTYLMTHVRPA
ncbi:hypothetical protein BDW02DRAFT_190418 [Decorospora gaudefroyi]|uniref:Uncharacterized protein n=1 Tax=Decorospora gaudefroyi TaxID=184978 RepID=A0A6A5KMM4_9PLEO|nr:hypothetical protein BDW02DRAFT_190418 [Decorospora gaudefroyi]